MLKERSSGVLLHPTSLPGRYGIGSLGKPAHEFIDFLVKARQRYWQILPLGPTGYADSPYQCFSAHAGNPNLIDLDILVQDRLLSNSDLTEFPVFPADKVEYDAVQKARLPLLRKAWQNFSGHADDQAKMAYRNYIKEQAHWINDYALFMAIKASRDLKPWYQWETPLKMREPGAIRELRSTLLEEIDFHHFLQFIFFRQWTRVKEYAHSRKIKIIGDIPLYVAHDSADAWANPGIFEFDQHHDPIRVGGVPPDYFSETGQLWGNPLFRWDVMQENGYAWWIERIRTNLFLYDVIRIDHFRGFAAYWAVPYAEKTAINGTWVPCPGQEFFARLKQEFGELPIIAEDLGVITPDVETLRDGFELPGMKILQFAFDSSEANDYLPHNYVKNCIVYTGTHDNDTLVGWFRGAAEADRHVVLEYLNCDDREIHWSFIRLAMASVANTAIIPMQDILGLDSGARMNLPGTTQGNWQWRVRAEELQDNAADRLAYLSQLYGRVKKKQKDEKPSLF